MKNQYSVKEKLTLGLLLAGVFCFGVILPDSLSDHNKLVHFSAHFGMSFLLALCAYMLCTFKLKTSRAQAYTLLIAATLLIGVIYKYWEISSQGVFERFNFSTAIELTGVRTSMYQNLSGLLGAILLIEGLVVKNLVTSAYKAAKINSLSENQPSQPFENWRIKNLGPVFHGASLPGGIQRSPESSEN